MDRRLALRNILLIASGAAIIPVSLRGVGGASIRLNTLTIDAQREALLAEVVETLIPTTDTPGAKELNIHLFVLKMIDDCHDASDQKLFENGLKEVDVLATRQFGQGFIACDHTQRKELIESFMNKRDVSADMFAFASMVKHRTVQGYLNSEYVMTELLPHKMIPDPYNGYYPANHYQG